MTNQETAVNIPVTRSAFNDQDEAYLRQRRLGNASNARQSLQSRSRSRLQARQDEEAKGLTKFIYTVSQKNCANLFFAPCLSNMNRFQ